MTPKKKKCPICGTKMTYEGSDFVCRGCGYHASYGTFGSHTNRTPAAGSITNPNYNTQNTYNANSYNPNPNIPNSNRPNPNIPHNHLPHNPSMLAGKQINRIFIYGLIFFIGILLLGLVSYSVITNISEKKSDTDTFADREEYEETNSSSIHSFKTPTTKLRLPESELFQQFITKLFRKDYQEVTFDDLAQVTALHLYEKEEYLVIAYTLQDNSTDRFFINQTRINTADFACFPKLRSLEIHNSLNAGDLDGLTELTKLWCRNSPRELLSIVDPLQLTDLGIDNDLFIHGLENIEAFSNVKYLRLKSIRAKELNALLELENLTALELIDGDQIEDFSALYKMPQLESLTVDSNKLRDIGFVSNMPNLKELSIQNSLVMKLDALVECANTLQKLNLSNNYKIVDRNYSVVSQLTNLTDLTLTTSYDHEAPPFLPLLANMPALTRLSIQGYDNFAPIADAPQLEELTLTRCYANDYSALELLPNLKTLNLNDISIMQPALESIGKLTQLERLYCDDDFIWGDCNGLLNLPNLKEYYMKDCTTGFNVTNIKLNENLKILYLSHITTKALVNGEWDYQSNNENNFYLADYADIFRNYPNLEELYLAENTLSNVSFSEGLQHLKVLDITDNYVTDLSPLSELAELESVLCARNAIVYDGGLGTDVLIKN